MRTAIRIVLFSLIGCAAEAQAPSGSAERTLRAFTACRSVPQTDARLACFEKATDALEAGLKSREVRIVDKQEIQTARRSLFGFTLPRIDLFGGRDDKDKRDTPAVIETTVASARALADGHVEIRLTGEDGAVWQTTEPMDFPPHPGDKIRIRQGTLGGYFIATGGKSYRSMRLR